MLNRILHLTTSTLPYEMPLTLGKFGVTPCISALAAVLAAARAAIVAAEASFVWPVVLGGPCRGIA